MNIGCVYAFVKSYTNTPSLGSDFVECNGQVLNDMTSPFHNQTMPDLNSTNRFLRGSTASGSTGGSTSASHTHGSGRAVASSGALVAFVVQNTSVATIPPFYSVVWVIKIK